MLKEDSHNPAAGYIDYSEFGDKSSQAIEQSDVLHDRECRVVPHDSSHLKKVQMYLKDRLLRMKKGDQDDAEKS